MWSTVAAWMPALVLEIRKLQIPFEEHLPLPFVQKVLLDEKSHNSFT